MIKMENLDKALFYGAPPYNIPEIFPENLEIHRFEWIPFNYAKTAKNRDQKGIHFYVDDYQFERLWNHPDKYIPLLSEFAAVCTPDFSQFIDMPVAMRIYNHYRKHWLGAYWQAHGIHVVPTICWSDEESYEWCFDGEPRGGTISISSVGTQGNLQTQERFKKGCMEAMSRLNPTQILWYGNLSDEFDWNVVKITPHYKEIERRRKNGR